MKSVIEFLFWNPQYYLIIMPAILAISMYAGNKLYERFFAS